MGDEANLLVKNLPALCRRSEALYAICLARQISLRTGLQQHFYSRFDDALLAFRTELHRSVDDLEDGTFLAGLLLSSIGVCQCHTSDFHVARYCFCC